MIEVQTTLAEEAHGERVWGEYDGAHVGTNDGDSRPEATNDKGVLGDVGDESLISVLTTLTEVAGGVRGWGGVIMKPLRGPMKG